MSAISELNEISERLSFLVNDGDRIGFTMANTVEFLYNDTQKKPIVFNIPMDGAYFVTTVNLYAARRWVNSDASLVESTFQSVDWASFNRYPATSAFIRPISGTFSIKTSRNEKYQNQAIPIGLAFSTRFPMSGETNGLVAANGTPFIGGLNFVIPEYIPRGGSLTIEVSLGFTADAATQSVYFQTGDAAEYQVKGVVSGYKRIKSFK